MRSRRFSPAVAALEPRYALDGDAWATYEVPLPPIATPAPVGPGLVDPDPTEPFVGDPGPFFDPWEPVPQTDRIVDPYGDWA